MPGTLALGVRAVAAHAQFAGLRSKEWIESEAGFWEKGSETDRKRVQPLLKDTQRAALVMVINKQGGVERVVRDTRRYLAESQPCNAQTYPVCFHANRLSPVSTFHRRTSWSAEAVSRNFESAVHAQRTHRA